MTQCAAEHGIGQMEHSYVSQVVARRWQLVQCPGADLLPALFCPPASHIHHLAQSLMAVPFPGSCDKNLPIIGTGEEQEFVYHSGLGCIWRALDQVSAYMYTHTYTRSVLVQKTPCDIIG